MSGKKEEENSNEAPSKRTRSRRKKEERKPWTKKERKLIFIVLVVTIFCSAVLAFSAREWKLPGLPRVNLKKPDFDFGQTIVLDNKNGQQTYDFSGIIHDFRDKTNDLSGVYGFYVYKLDDNVGYGLYEDEVFQAASLIKLPVIVALYQEAEAGNFDLEETYTLTDSDKIGGSGSLYSQKAGTQYTYRELVEYMGQESDNTAFGVVKNRLGQRILTETFYDLNLEHTSIEENETSPKDIATIFKKLYNGEILTQNHSDEILGYLTDTIYEQWLAAGLPEDIRIAHKFGRETHVVNDAGIVFSDHPYVVVIMTKGVVEHEADEVIPELSRMIYDYETKSE